jgi:hypothetical protein
MQYSKLGIAAQEIHAAVEHSVRSDVVTERAKAPDAMSVPTERYRAHKEGDRKFPGAKGCFQDIEEVIETPSAEAETAQDLEETNYSLSWTFGGEEVAEEG